MSSSNPVKILPEASMRVCLPQSIVTFARRVSFFMLEILVPNVLRTNRLLKGDRFDCLVDLADLILVQGFIGVIFWSIGCSAGCVVIEPLKAWLIA